jgi:Ca2+/Na+ antiporter
MLIALENRVIDFLTMITWWTEVRFNKDSILFGLLCQTTMFLFVGLGCIVIFSELQESKSREMYYISFVFLIVGVIYLKRFLSLLQDVPNLVTMFGNVLSNPEGTKRRELYFTSKNRHGAFFVALLFLVLTVFIDQKPLIYFTIALLFETTAFFFFSCDPIPQEEKERRKENNIAHKINSGNKN